MTVVVQIAITTRPFVQKLVIERLAFFSMQKLHFLQTSNLGSRQHQKLAKKDNDVDIKSKMLLAFFCEMQLMHQPTEIIIHFSNTP